MIASPYTPDPYHSLPDPDRQPQFYDGVSGKRFFAWLIDTVAILLLTLLVGLLTFTLALWIFPVTFAVLSWLYRVVTISARSATPGMRIAGIEFRDRRGDRFDGGQAVVHTTAYMLATTVVLAQIISIILMVGTRQGQSLHDLLLGSTAINAPAN
ncbi:MAG: RDD family protein [Pseudomonadota bacterium]